MFPDVPSFLSPPSSPPFHLRADPHHPTHSRSHGRGQHVAEGLWVSGFSGIVLSVPPCPPAQASWQPCLGACKFLPDALRFILTGVTPRLEWDTQEDSNPEALRPSCQPVASAQ